MAFLICWPWLDEVGELNTIYMYVCMSMTMGMVRLQDGKMARWQDGRTARWQERKKLNHILYNYSSVPIPILSFSIY